MIRNLTLVSWLAACLVTATSVFGQMGPPDPADVAARCVASMEDASDRTTGAIGDATAAAVDRIARLDADGAPDRAIIRAGEDGIKRVRLIGRFGSARITNIEGHCVRLLVRLEAERDLIARVRAAADGFREDIRNATQRGSGAIRQAVADAIG